MTDKQTIIISWIFVVLFIPVSAWNVDAGMVVGGIATVIRWGDVKSFNETVGKSKDPYWVCSFVYWVFLSALYLVLKLSGILGTNTFDSEFKCLFVMLFLPFVPRMIKYDYKRFIQF